MEQIRISLRKRYTQAQRYGKSLNKMVIMSKKRLNVLLLCSLTVLNYVSDLWDKYKLCMSIILIFSTLVWAELLRISLTKRCTDLGIAFVL